jgi:PKD repeat protein
MVMVKKNKKDTNMRHLRTLLFLFTACLVALPTSFAQNTTTQGKEFWLSFMHNGFKDHSSGGWVTTQVLISAKRDCTGTVSNPLSGWSQSFSVSADSITTVEIPSEQGYHNGSQHERIFEKGIKVTADDTVSVYCTNIAYVSFDASFVLPVESLGDEYIIQCCEQSRPGHNPYVWNNETTAFVIVATEDNTEIDITPTVNTLGGHPANRLFTITMHAGETYHVRSERITDRPIDLSGTRIRTHNCKRIAVFNGNTITCVPNDAGNGYDHVFEQAMPLRSWGRNFIVTCSKNRLRDFVKVTSSADDNIVTMNGETLDTLRAGQSYYFSMLESEGSCYLQTTQPSAVYLYHTSHEYYSIHDDNLGDPSMVWIAPVEQRINDVTFSTFDHPDINIETHSVNIIVHTKDSANVLLDGEIVAPSNFHRGNDDYSYARLDISHGVHRITCHNGFNAHVYGFGRAKGYAYLVGSTASDLSTTVLIDGETVQQNDTINSCSLSPITFGAEINYQDFELEWDFGDGSPPSHDVTAIHTYDSESLYEVTLTVTSEDIPCQASSTITQTFYVDMHHLVTDTDTVRLCYDNSHPAAYTWVDGNTYTSDTLIVEKELPYGDCNGLFTLDLSFVDTETQDVFVPPHEDEIVCDAYDWEISGRTYHFDTSGEYSHIDDLAPFDCERETRLHLSLSYSPRPFIGSEDLHPHHPITATEFNVNHYTYHVKDTITDANAWHLDRCRWDISKPSWRLVPNPDDPFECTVYAMDWTEDTVWLSFTAVNDCDSVTVRYDLHPSFYSIDENGLETFNIAPNPTTGLVTVTGENLRHAEVFNMLGQKMLWVHGKGNEFHLDMTTLPAGIYFVTVTDEKGRKCVRKVVKE